MALIPIDKNRLLNPGDRVELHFKTTGMAWVRATQIALIESRTKSRTDWKIIRFKEYPDQPTLLVMEVEVIKPVAESEPEVQRAGLGVSCAIIAATVAALGVVYYLTLQESFLIVAETFQTVAETGKEVVESPVGKVAVAGTGIGIAAAGIAALLLFVLPRK